MREHTAFLPVQQPGLMQHNRALKYVKEDGSEGVLDGLLVPANVGQTYQIAAQAGKSSLSVHTPIHFALSRCPSLLLLPLYYGS